MFSLLLPSYYLYLVFITKNPITNEVAILDVGQGDSILVRDWLGKTILIDTGEG